jgi:hypothetical protein
MTAKLAVGTENREIKQSVSRSSSGAAITEVKEYS